VGSDGLIRTAVTNLLVRSEEFESASWTAGQTSVNANVIQSPNGSLTADKLIENSNTSTHLIQQIIAHTSGTTYTASCFVKVAERTFFSIAFGSGFIGTQANSFFDLSNGTTPTSGATVVNVGDGWFRCSFTVTATASASSAVQFRLATSTSVANYTGDGTSGIYLWGAQLEQSSTVGEYIPTTSTINSAPRFDHNPTTGESLGLLVEEARTNLSQWSEDFSDAYWTKTSCTITSNESTAPDGTLTADLWSNTGTPGVMHNSITKDATARTYTSSLWVKGTLTQLTVSLDDGTTTNRGRVQFNLSTNTVGSIFNEGLFTNTSGTLTQFSNSWVRVTVTTTTSIGTTIRFRPFFSGANSILRIWGAQVEEGAFPTSYIPTTTAAVTRSADVASISGSNFSSWYRQDEGTVFNSVLPRGSNVAYSTFSDGTSSNRFQLYAENNGVLLRTSASGSAANNSIGNQSVNLPLLVAYAYGSGGTAASLNGGSSTSTTQTLPTTNSVLGIGQYFAFTSGNSICLRRLTYWPTRLPNSTLQTLTQ
jgi:hypothetical protein